MCVCAGRVRSVYLCVQASPHCGQKVCAADELVRSVKSGPPSITAPRASLLPLCHALLVLMMKMLGRIPLLEKVKQVSAVPPPSVLIQRRHCRCQLSRRSNDSLAVFFASTALRLQCRIETRDKTEAVFVRFAAASQQNEREGGEGYFCCASGQHPSLKGVFPPSLAFLISLRRNQANPFGVTPPGRPQR